MSMITELLPQRRFLYKAILIAFFLAITYLFFKEHWQDKKEKLLPLIENRWLIAYFLYTGYMLSATVIGRYFSKPYMNVFGSFGLFTKDGNVNNDLVKNILMFIPYTFLFIKAFKPAHPFKATLILSIATTLFIEISQLIGWLGEFQFADIIHNIMGGMLGYGLWYLIKTTRERH